MKACTERSGVGIGRGRMGLFFFSSYPYYFPLDTTYSSALMMEAAGSSRLYGVMI
jgi:hypothetical protein